MWWRSPSAAREHRLKPTVKPRQTRLERTNGSFGFEWDGRFISDIELNGPAHRDGLLTIGDQLVEVRRNSRALPLPPPHLLRAHPPHYHPGATPQIDGELVHNWSNLAISTRIGKAADAINLVVVPNVEGYKVYHPERVVDPRIRRLVGG
jgi:hypothetical protein